MAIIEQGVLGAFRGKVGNVIGYVRNGVACVRSMPGHYHDRRSEAQLKNRGRMAMVMKVMSAVRPAVKAGFGCFATGMTEMNVATRENYYRVVDEGDGGLEYRLERLVLSRGAVEMLDGLMMALEGRDVALFWRRDGLGDAGCGDDEVTVVMLNGERMEMAMRRAVARRGDGGVRMVLPAGWESEEVYCYVMVERDGRWSDSVSLGRIGGGMMGVKVEEAVNESDMGFYDVVGGFISSSDQSAIKVLPGLGQRGGERGVFEGEGRVEKEGLGEDDDGGDGGGGC